MLYLAADYYLLGNLTSVLNESEDLTASSIVALLTYIDAHDQRKKVIKDNNQKPGIYRWINKTNEKSYIGSSVNLGYRLKQYYSISFLNRKKSISSISRALVKYGHSKFKLEILEYCEPDRTTILKREQHYLDLLKPEYNILKIAGSPLGYKHTEQSLAKIRNRKLSKTHLETVLARINSEEHKTSRPVGAGCHPGLRPGRLR